MWCVGLLAGSFGDGPEFERLAIGVGVAVVNTGLELVCGPDERGSPLLATFPSVMTTPLVLQKTPPRCDARSRQLGDCARRSATGESGFAEIAAPYQRSAPPCSLNRDDG
jgi:hypothetical protein